MSHGDHKLSGNSCKCFLINNRSDVLAVDICYLTVRKISGKEFLIITKNLIQMFLTHEDRNTAIIVINSGYLKAIVGVLVGFLQCNDIVLFKVIFISIC